MKQKKQVVKVSIKSIQRIINHPTIDDIRLLSGIYGCDDESTITEVLKERG